MEKKIAWEIYQDKDLKKLEKVCAEYREFLDNGKTERECIDTIVNTIEAEGFLPTWNITMDLFIHTL